MSHIYTYQAKIKDPNTFIQICQDKFDAFECTVGKHKIQQFGSNFVNCDASFLLPGWREAVGTP